MAEPSKYPWKDNDLRPIQRVITDHDGEGKSVFSTVIPEDLPGKIIGAPAPFRLGYCTNKTPLSLANGSDIETYAKYLENPPGIVIPGGTVVRYVDMPPGATSPMHRTVSLDYGVVLEGEMEVVLDSGETRLLKRGDLAVQRGTMHAWRNASKTEWARMLYFLQEVEPIEVVGTKLAEDYGGLTGVRKSEN
ncbi:hypothetical protein B0T25DRAFT_447794 [Lasiosphaeria hispida]|uniref:Cupin type-2 domain-containing protein n=1 Tax=Lasiosphaeria hispida TaxID=260671 RepID=A0AAJ0MJ20_9PEZI|nr:hypothetical protein B0T25DRAFT_447794 [Lasiosphaeria hispida]